MHPAQCDPHAQGRHDAGSCSCWPALLSGCGYNSIQQKDEAVKAAWSEVLNQYKRRADLMPNLVTTVQGYAATRSRC